MSEAKSGSITTIGLLGVVFVTLKLTGYINWSWWYVTMPFWGGAGIIFGFIGLFLIVSLICNSVAAVIDKKK